MPSCPTFSEGVIKEFAELAQKRRKFVGQDAILSHVFRGLLWKFADADVFKFDRRTFRFHAQVTGARLGAAAAGNLFAVHPQSHFAVDGPDVIVVPFAGAPTELLAREAARAVRRQRGKRIQPRFSYGENVEIGRASCRESV